MRLDDGFLLVLPRDEAKAFFGIRDDAERVEYLEQQVGSDASMSLSCLGKWQQLHDALTRLEIADSALGQCLLGGRPMHQGDYHVVLIRPDVVPLLADQLSSIDEDVFGRAWNDATSQVDGWSLCKQIGKLYGHAGELGGAVVFVAKTG